MSIATIKVILIGTLFVLTFWGITFFLPLHLGFENSGQFGDTFGSINALFSGVGFIALTVTILIQIEDSKKQREQHHFEVLLKLHDDVKKDLENLSFDELRGTELINHLQSTIVKNPHLIESKNFDQQFNYLFCTVQQTIDLLKYSKKFFKDGDEKEIIVFKIRILYLIYFNTLIETVIESQISNPIFQLFREQLIILTEEIWDKKTSNTLTHKSASK